MRVRRACSSPDNSACRRSASALIWASVSKSTRWLRPPCPLGPWTSTYACALTVSPVAAISATRCAESSITSDG